MRQQKLREGRVIEIRDKASDRNQMLQSWGKVDWKFGPRFLGDRSKRETNPALRTVALRSFQNRDYPGHIFPTCLKPSMTSQVHCHFFPDFTSGLSPYSVIGWHNGILLHSTYYSFFSTFLYFTLFGSHLFYSTFHKVWDHDFVFITVCLMSVSVIKM